MSNFYDPNAPHQLPPRLAAPLPGLPEEFIPSPQTIYSHYQPLGEQQELRSPTFGHWLGRNAEVPNPQTKVAPRARRRTLHSGDQVKHRRTRSGCYTCRHRRVKCDEGRPICQRCRKGSRDCVYPEQASAPRASVSGKSGQSGDSGQESGSSPEGSDDEGTGDATGSVKAEFEPASTRRESLPSAPSQTSEIKTEPSDDTGSSEQNFPETKRMKEESPFPQPDEPHSLPPEQLRPLPPRRTSSGIAPARFSPASSGTSPWSHLEKDLQFYLDFHKSRINFHHYLWRHDFSEFIHNTLIETALSHEPLLYAVVTFAAYHHSISQPDGKVSDFLRYYNKSLSSLRKSLSSSQAQSDGTILTVLQLAAFEEFLGDWVNLSRHQTAASEMIKGIYTPETIIRTDKGRKILFWYHRFDIWSSWMTGDFGTTIGIDWFYAIDRCYQDLCRQHPLKLEYKIESLFSQARLHLIEFGQLFLSVATGEMTREVFLLNHEQFKRTLYQWGDKLQPFLSDRENIAASFDEDSRIDPDSPRACAPLFIGEFWPVNYLYLDVLTLEAVHRSQTAKLVGGDPGLDPIILQSCQMIEAVERFPRKPLGATLPVQGNISLISILAPREDKYLQWLREKFFIMEGRDGYVYPSRYRQKLADDWGDPSLKSWWMPDESTYPPVVRAVRAFAEERSIKPQTPLSGALEGIKTVFSNLQMRGKSGETAAGLEDEGLELEG